MEKKNIKKKWLKTIQFLAAYLVAAWTFLQFIEWILKRYNISPHWVDILLCLFIGIIPSLIIYLHHQERINKRILKLREKIIFPLNIVLLILVVYFGFGNSDLGATTKSIDYENELGEQKSALITKEEFRVGIPIFNFEQLNTDSTTAWLRYGIGKLLYEDLLQNKNISPDLSYISSTTDKIREASMFYDFYVDGTYEKQGTNYEITTYIRKASNGKELKKQIFTGPDVLTLLDDISVFITSQSGFIESNELKYIDLPINESISNSLPALEEYVNGNYRDAYNIDPTFALAYLERAKIASGFNQGKLETQDIIDKAFALKNKLPLQKQLEVFILRNLAYSQYDEAERQVKLQLEVDPNNNFYNDVLFAIYGETKQIDKYYKKSEELFTKNPNGENGLSLAIAAMVIGQHDRLLKELDKYEIINPDIATLKLEPLLLNGNIKAAEKLLEELKIQNPNNSNRTQIYDSVINHLKTNKSKPNNLKQFVGQYRSSTSEQTYTFWMEGNRLILFVKNQKMRAYLPAGPNAIASGFVNDRTWRKDVIKNKNNKIVGLKVKQYNWRNTITRFYWKLDSSILKANESLEQGKLKEAIPLYEKAIYENPEHSYLKNILAYANYINNTEKEALKLQHETFSGSYGPRTFWLENGKFFYKRKSESIELSKVELLPISENRYINLTNLNTLITFETSNDGSIASVPYSFNIEKMEWNRLDGETNYFTKNN